MRLSLTLGQIRVLYPLVFADPETVEERLQELYDWRMDQATMTAKAFIGTAASFETALLLSLFKRELHDVASYWIVAGFLGGLVAAAPGVIVFLRMARLRNEYVAALALFGRLRLRRAP